MKNTLVAVSSVLIAISSAAFAQSETPSFTEVDTNADGVLNKQEADHALPALGLSDANQDGVISKSDVKKVLPDIEFEGDDESAIGSAEYQQIVQVMEQLMDRAG